MKKYFISAVFAIVMLLNINCYAGTKYDFMTTNDVVSVITETYDTNIVNSSLLSSYLNQIVSSPNELYKIFKNANPNKEMVKFVKGNKLFVKKLLWCRIVCQLAKLNVSDNQLSTVVGYLLLDNFKETSNETQQQRQQRELKKRIAKQMTSFRVYEFYKKPDNLRKQIGIMLTDMHTAHVKGEF